MDNKDLHEIFGKKQADEKQEMTEVSAEPVDGTSESQVPKSKGFVFRRAVTEKKKKKVYTVGLIPVYFAFFGCFILTVIHRLFFGKDFYAGLDDGVQLIILSVVAVVLYILPALIYFFVMRKKRGASLGLKRFSPACIPALIFGFFLLLLLIAAEKFAIAYFFGVTGDQAMPDIRLQNPFVLICVYAVIPAVCEELFFRGVFFKELADIGGGITAILITATAFSLVHFNLSYFLIYFTAGIILGICRHISGSCIPSMILHALNNIFSLFFAGHLTFIASERAGNVFVLVILILVAFLFALLFLKSLETLNIKKSISILCDDDSESTKSNKHDKVYVFYGKPEKFFSDTGYTFHKFLRVLFSPIFIMATIIFFLIVF